MKRARVKQGVPYASFPRQGCSDASCHRADCSRPSPSATRSGRAASPLLPRRRVVRFASTPRRPAATHRAQKPLHGSMPRAWAESSPHSLGVPSFRTGAAPILANHSQYESAPCSADCTTAIFVEQHEAFELAPVRLRGRSPRVRAARKALTDSFASGTAAFLFSVVTATLVHLINKWFPFHGGT